MTKSNEPWIIGEIEDSTGIEIVLGVDRDVLVKAPVIRWRIQRDNNGFLAVPLVDVLGTPGPADEEDSIIQMKDGRFYFLHILSEVLTMEEVIEHLEMTNAA